MLLDFLKERHLLRLQGKVVATVGSLLSTHTEADFMCALAILFESKLKHGAEILKSLGFKSVPFNLPEEALDIPSLDEVRKKVMGIVGMCFDHSYK